MNRLENMLVCTVNIKRGNKITVQHEKVLYETNDVIMITFFLTAKQKKKNIDDRKHFTINLVSYTCTYI